MTALKIIYVSRLLAGILLCLGVVILFSAVQGGDIQTVEKMIERYVPIFH